MDEKQFEDRVRSAIGSGKDLRRQLAKLVTEAAESFHSEVEGLIALTRKVMDLATETIREMLPDEAQRRMREVVDGLADGLTRAANAAKFTIDEARGAGMRFAHDDVVKLTADLRTLGDLFVDTVVRATVGATALSSSQARALEEHARRTFASVRPALASALGAIRDYAHDLGTDGARAGVEASRQTLGRLFRLMARTLGRAADTLGGDQAGP